MKTLSAAAVPRGAVPPGGGGIFRAEEFWARRRLIIENENVVGVPTVQRATMFSLKENQRL
jgi:hypothetical protein